MGLPEQRFKLALRDLYYFTFGIVGIFLITPDF